MILPILAGVLTLGWLVSQFFTKPFLTVVSSLNGYLLVFLILGLVLHGTPRNFLQAVTKAVPATAGILVQFPLYAAMAAILTKADRPRRHDRLRRSWPSSSRSIGGGGASPSSLRSTPPCWASWSPPAAANGWWRPPT